MSPPPPQLTLKPLWQEFHNILRAGKHGMEKLTHSVQLGARRLGEHRTLHRLRRFVQQLLGWWFNKNKCKSFIKINGFVQDWGLEQ